MEKSSRRATAELTFNQKIQRGVPFLELKRLTDLNTKTKQAAVHWLA